MSGGMNTPFGLSPYQNLSGNGDITKIQTFKIDRACPTIYAGDPVTMAQFDTGTNAMVGTPGTIIPLSALSLAAAAEAPILGYLLSVEYTSPNNIYTNKFPFWSAGSIPVDDITSITAKVNIDPHVILQVQVSTSDDNFAHAVFLNSYINLNGTLRVAGAAAINQNPPYANYATRNPRTGDNEIGTSAYYLDATSLFASSRSTVAEEGFPLANFKVLGIVEPQNLGLTGATNAQLAKALNDLVPGVDMPFVTVYGVINNHVYKSGTGGIVFAA